MRTGLFALLVIGCGGGQRRGEAVRAPEVTATVPERAATVGDGVLALLPPEPDLVLEIDLARARKNALIGPVVDAWIDAADGALAGQAMPLDAPRPPLAGAAWVVVAAYGVGTRDAATVTLVEPPAGMAIANSTRIKGDTVALAPPPWIEKIRVAAAGGPSAKGDRELLALRARAMPARAEGAVLRAAMRLTDDARIRLAGAFGIEPAPRAVSAWADVADDAALVLHVDARDAADPEAPRRLAEALRRVYGRIAVVPIVKSLGLAPPVANTRIEGVEGSSWLRVVTVIPPGRLKWAVAQAAPAAPGGKR